MELKREKTYLEILRVIAVLLVMYNHSQAYLSFQNQTGAEYGISLFLSMLCRSAVPLFFMISGALLLGKNESMKQLLQKRVVRMVLVLILFSLLFAVKRDLQSGTSFSLWTFFLMLPQTEVFLPYWYLYSYIAFLLILPFLRAMAQHLKKEYFFYLAALQIVFGAISPCLGHLWGYWIDGYFDMSALFDTIIFYPLLGYGFDQYVTTDTKDKWKAVPYNLSVILAAVVSGVLIENGVKESGTYQDYFLWFLISIPALVLFWDCKKFFTPERFSGRAKKIWAFLGDKVLGIYLLEGFIGCNGRMEIIYQTLNPYIGLIPAYLIEILIIFAIRLVLVTILKKIPVFRSIL